MSTIWAQSHGVLGPGFPRKSLNLRRKLEGQQISSSKCGNANEKRRWGGGGGELVMFAWDPSIHRVARGMLASTAAKIQDWGVSQNGPLLVGSEQQKSLKQPVEHFRDSTSFEQHLISPEAAPLFKNGAKSQQLLPHFSVAICFGQGRLPSSQGLTRRPLVSFQQSGGDPN